jgi:Kef-type K+ transport system membrane component KefB
MYAVLAAVLHAMISITAAVVIAPYSLDPTATSESLRMLCAASAIISVIGFVSTTTYLSRRVRAISWIMAGVSSGLLCGAIIGLAAAGIEYSLILYLAILAPTLLAVLLASLLVRPRSGWQT